MLTCTLLDCRVLYCVILCRLILYEKRLCYTVLFLTGVQNVLYCCCYPCNYRYYDWTMITII